jgi:hypothetical protein
MNFVDVTITRHGDNKRILLVVNANDTRFTVAADDVHIVQHVNTVNLEKDQQVHVDLPKLPSSTLYDEALASVLRAIDGSGVTLENKETKVFYNYQGKVIAEYEFRTKTLFWRDGCPKAQDALIKAHASLYNTL